MVTWQWHLLGAFRLLPPVPLPRNAVTASRPAASSRHAVRTAPSSNLSFPQPRAHFHGRLGPGAGRPAGVTHHQLRPAQQQRAVHTQVGARASARVPAGRGCRGLRGADRGRALLPKDRQVGAVRPEGRGHQLRQERRHPHPARHRAVLLHADRRDADERCVAARSAPRGRSAVPHADAFAFRVHCSSHVSPFAFSCRPDLRSPPPRPRAETSAGVLQPRGPSWAVPPGWSRGDSPRSPPVVAVLPPFLTHV